MRFHFRFLIGALIACSAMVSFGLIAGFADTSMPSTSTAATNSSRDWQVNIFLFHETFVENTPNNFIARVRNFCGHDTSIWNTAELQIGTPTDRLEDAAPSGDAPIAGAANDDSPRIVWKIIGLSKDVEMGMTDTGVISKLPLPYAGSQFIDSSFSAQVFKKAGRYKVIAVLMRGTTELARSESHFLTVTPKDPDGTKN